MTNRFFALFTLLVWILLAPFTAQADLFAPTLDTPKFLPVDQAFAFDFQQHNNQLTLSWQIKPGYYLYQQKISVVPHQAQLGPFKLPPSLEHQDEFFGQVAIFRQQLELQIPLLQASKEAHLTVTYQGCADAGFCYPPETKEIPLQLVQATNTAPTAPVNSTPTVNEQTPVPAESATLFSLPESQLWLPLWGLLMGLLVSVTPCVLPMYPLISGLILGSKRPSSSRRVFLLIMSYIQGMALTYTALGFVVALAGLQFQAAFQHPYVLIGLSLLFILLACSMFGLYSLQLPSSLQTTLTRLSNTQHGGSLPGVFVMGAIAGLICSPCTTAPLSAILLYIAQSDSPLLGSITLYLYAIGMGVPLILVALFGHKLLPKTGPWMQYVKEGFGFIILLLPILLLERIYGELWQIRMLSLLGVLFFGWCFTLSLRSQTGRMRLLQLLFLGLALLAVKPLQDWLFNSGNHSAQHNTAAATALFTPINNLSELESTLSNTQGKVVMLDLYADWCVACKQFEKETFNDPEVRALFQQMVLLQADVTPLPLSEEHQTLLKRYQVHGLPTILFFDSQGNELPALRINGFMPAKKFAAHLQQLIPTTAPPPVSTP